jgi:glycosyltransferase involved in cell wall biosynthesis
MLGQKRVLAVMLHPLGGIRTYILYNYPTLTAAGYRFTFVAPTGERLETLREELHCWEAAEFVAVPRTNLAYRLVATVRRLLRSRRFDLVHSHGFSAAAVVAIANFGIGVPHIFTSHDVIRPDAQFPGITGRAKRLLLGHLLSRIDRIVAVTNDARENHFQWLPALKRRSSRMVTIVHGIDTCRFGMQHEPTNGALRARLGIPKDVFLLGFLGRFMEQKGFLYLVEAMDQLLARGNLARAMHLLAVGSGDFSINYHWELERRPQVSRFITFMEHVPGVMPVLAEIDLLVMPSLWEACGLLAMEGMCAGVPVLGTDCIGLREVLRGTPSVMVPPANAGALAQALEHAIESPWTEAARRYAPEAQRRFDVGPAALRLRELFDELTA